MKQTMKKSVLKKALKPILALALLGAILLSPARETLNLENLQRLLNTFRGSPYAPLLYVLVYMAGVVLALPGIALTAFAGPLFGFWRGVLWVALGANLGCQLTFFISRFFGRGPVQRFIREDSLVDRISKRIEENGFLVMLYLRLLPIFPFNGVNYVSGLTNITYREYTLATFIGMLPGILVYVHLSAAAAEAGRNPAGLVVSVLLLAVFTAASVYFKKRQKKCSVQSVQHLGMDVQGCNFLDKRLK